MLTTKPEFIEKFNQYQYIEKLCSYFEYLYNSYQESWTDKLLLQAKMDSLNQAGFQFDAGYQIVEDGGIDLMILDDESRIKLLDTLFDVEKGNIMVWWIFEHMGSTWLKYIRGMDLFLNSMRMVGETVVNPVEVNEKTGKTEEVVDEKMWLIKMKIYADADRLEERLTIQKRGLFLNSDFEPKFMEVLSANNGDRSDLDVGKWIKEAKKNAN